MVLALLVQPACAERSTFRTYDAQDGLASVGGACMLQDRAGYVLVCTEHGVFAYDGRRFTNLGPDQGLRQGGVIYGLALTSTGRVAVGFADEVLVSDRPSDASHPPSALSFRSVHHPGLTFYSERLHRIAAWRDGLVLLAGDGTERIVVPDSRAPYFEPLGYSVAERALLANATAVFSVRGSLWETFDDGRLCAADPGAVKCYDAAQGLRSGPWSDVIAGPDGRVLARSASSVASLDATSGRWTVTDLPDQGGRYVNYRTDLGLFLAPDGGLITQADHGLAVLGRDGWRLLTVEDGAPPGTIVSVMTDATGQLWFQVLGRGLVRWVGYRQWETVQKADGLSDGLAWKMARPPGGPLWVSTDTGVDEVVRRGSVLRVSRVFPGAAFAIAVGPHGELWRGYGGDGLRVTDPLTGSETRIGMPAVNAILSCGGETVWLGTQAGLFSVVDHPGATLNAVLEGSARTAVVDMLCDGLGGLFYLSAGHLRHRRADGTDLSVAGIWPGDGFEPLALAFGRDGSLWAGGAGGLYRFALSGDRIASYQLVPTVDTRTNSITAVMVDHRGWVWAGTALGVSVFNGKRWVSVDSDGGLVSDDVDQGGLREDSDGSVWIATSQGLSHLLDPRWLFADRPIQAVVSGAQLGDLPVVGRSLPYTGNALTIQFGTPNYGAERSVLFKYQLAGVDSGWVESTTGLVRYAFVPPGRHVLTVIGYDQLTHTFSPPATLVVDIAYPWWRQWWAETLWILCVLGLAYGVMRLRFRSIMARQAELQRHVSDATAQLRYQAAHDSLTGLFNRCEIERQLAARLSGSPASCDMIVALVDIDHFKRVNDTYGHLGGDDVLRAMGRLVSKVVRDGEYAGRYGGEEILLLLDDTDGRAAERVLDLHHAIRSCHFKVAGQAIRVTCSIGVAWAAAGDDWESLIGRADQALYDAKDSGRDQVVESGRSAPAAKADLPLSAWYDPVTSLPNRALFARQLQQTFDRNGENRFALHLIDLDRFDEAHDRHDRPAADRVLRVLAERLRGCARQRDSVAHLGGDEFAIIQLGVSDADMATELAGRILVAMGTPFVVDGIRLEVGASIGVALAFEHGANDETLVHQAKTALSRTKNQARRNFHVFSPDLDSALQDRRALEHDLQHAIFEDEMTLVYQPIVCLQGEPGQDLPPEASAWPPPGTVIGFEALLRWNHPTRGLIMPEDFVFLSEGIGAIERLGAWIMMRACADAVSWPRDMKVAINVSPIQFRSGRLAERLQEALAETGIRPGRVELEITETALLPDNDLTLETLRQLRHSGVHLVLDDFGTGFSSLSYLRSFSFDRLKIDRSFVADMCEHEDAVAIIRAILGLGRSLNIAVTAEGVETFDQLQKLMAEGCNQAQGYLFGRPMPAQTVLGHIACVLQDSAAQGAIA